MMKIPVGLEFLGGERSEQEKRLLEILFTAHQDAARNNNNLSKMLCVNAYAGSESIVQSMAAGMLSFGGRHGPLLRARQLLRNLDPDRLRQGLRAGHIVPGLGNDFFKDRIDPAFQPLEDELRTSWPEHYAKLAQIAAIATEEKQLYLNPAILTATCCEILEVPEGIEELLVVLPRLPVWADLCARKVKRTTWFR